MKKRKMRVIWAVEDAHGEIDWINGLFGFKKEADKNCYRGERVVKFIEADRGKK